MRAIRAAVYSDYHARMSQALLELPETKWYCDPNARKDMLAAAIKRLNIKKKYVHFDKRRYFTGLLNNSDIYFTPMRLSTHMDHLHSGFAREPMGARFARTPLNKIKSRVVFFHEVIHYEYEGYVPHAHVLLAKNIVEYEYLKENFGDKEIHLVGQPGLDNAEFKPDRPKNIGLYLCLKRADSDKIIPRMLKDVERLIEHMDFDGSIYVKDHIGSGRATIGPVMQMVKDFCKKKKIKMVMVHKSKSFYDVADNVTYGLVQSSLSCHFYLRRLGVESFYYTSPRNKLESPFIKRSKMPPSTLNDMFEGNYDRKEYDNWLAEQFVLDGKCDHRLVCATKGERYDT